VPSLLIFVKNGESQHKSGVQYASRQVASISEKSIHYIKLSLSVTWNTLWGHQ